MFHFKEGGGVGGGENLEEYNPLFWLQGTFRKPLDSRVPRNPVLAANALMFVTINLQ